MPDVRTRSATTGDRNLQFRGAVSTGFSPVDFSPYSPGLLLCALVRKWTQNVEKIARFPGGEKRAQNAVTSLAVMVFSVHDVTMSHSNPQEF